MHNTWSGLTITQASKTARKKHVDTRSGKLAFPFAVKQNNETAETFPLTTILTTINCCFKKDSMIESIRRVHFTKRQLSG